MPNRPPPGSYGGTPRRFRLAADTRLSRIHGGRFGATSFNPTPADPHGGGGRFDSTEDDPYGFLYAAEDDFCAVSESLLRDRPLSETGAQLLPRQALAGRKISWIAPNRDLTLVSLKSGRDLAAVGQDSWLTKCESKDQGFTRRWGHALRRWAPWAEGFAWRSRREEDSLAFVFFEDRCVGAFDEIVEPALPSPNGNWLDREPGESYVRHLLAAYNVAIYR